MSNSKHGSGAPYEHPKTLAEARAACDCEYMMPLSEREAWILRVAMGFAQQQLRDTGVTEYEDAILYSRLSSPPNAADILPGEAKVSGVTRLAIELAATAVVTDISAAEVGFYDAAYHGLDGLVINAVAGSAAKARSELARKLEEELG